MEKIRREVRLFWTRNGKLLLQIIGVILLIIFIVQASNQYVIRKNEEEEKVKQTEEYKEQVEKKKVYKEEKEYIRKFINYCNQGNITQAYKMLSENCKTQKYPTIESFKNNYYNKIFIYKRDYEITQDGDNYKIKFLEDALQSGKIENRDYIEDSYKIEEDTLEGKSININLYNKI